MNSEMLIAAIATFGVAIVAAMSLLVAQRKVAAQRVALQRARVGERQRRRNTSARH